LIATKYNLTPRITACTIGGERSTFDFNIASFGIEDDTGLASSPILELQAL